MKKFLPFILLFLGILVLVGAYFLLIKPRNEGVKESIPQEEAAPEVPIEQRPVVSLTPSDDGHWLTLNIKDIRISAESLEYLLLYDLPDGRQQGVPGTVKIAGENSIERKLLLGSESSGKFRYDEGVERGTITIKFRDSKAKLVANFSSEFHLISANQSLDSSDGKFIYKLEKLPKKGYFVVMKTFGLPKQTDLSDMPYGVFSSLTSGLTGVVSIQGEANIYWFDGGNWSLVKDGKASDFGIFIGSNK